MMHGSIKDLGLYKFWSTKTIRGQITSAQNAKLSATFGGYSFLSSLLVPVWVKVAVISAGFGS